MMTLARKMGLDIPDVELVPLDHIDGLARRDRHDRGKRLRDPALRPY
jgi:hypothetical protein